MNTGKTLGIILIVAGAGIVLLAILWLVAQAVAGKLDIAAAILGLGLAAIIAAPLIGIGVFMQVKGRQESKEMAYVQQERKLLGLIQAQGQINVAQAALEIGTTRDGLKGMIYDLVDKGFFAGYINWQEGMLYSQDAAKLKAGSRCPNCNGELQLAGKGVIRCPYCGTDIFLTE
jgi:hypothetical protein